MVIIQKSRKVETLPKFMISENKTIRNPDVWLYEIFVAEQQLMHWLCPVTYQQKSD